MVMQKVFVRLQTDPSLTKTTRQEKNNKKANANQKVVFLLIPLASHSNKNKYISRIKYFQDKIHMIQYLANTEGILL